MENLNGPGDRVQADKSTLIRKREVLRRTGLSNSGLYAAIQAGYFPRQVPIGRRASAWVEEEVNHWIEERLTRRGARK